MALILLIIGGTNLITALGRYTPKSVVRGVQLSTGALLMAQGVKFMIGTSTFQAIRQVAEPYLILQSLGPVPVGMIIGVIGGLLTLFLMDNKRLPAGLFLVLGGILIGLGFQAGLSLTLFKLLFIFVFIFFTSPTASHSLANAAVLGHLKPMLDKK